MDEHPRADATLENLASLKAVRLREDPEATVTAEFESEPLRITRPPEIIVAPFRVLWPDNVKVPARLVSVPEPLRMPA